MKKMIRSIIIGLLLIVGLIGISTTEANAGTNVRDMDFNCNSSLDIDDLANVAANYNIKRNDSKWNFKYDLNRDNIIDIYDLVIMSKSIGTKIEPLSDNTDITSSFVDESFKNEVYLLIGKTSIESILYSDVKNITKLEIIQKEIYDLSGVEYFTALKNLNCDKNQLTILDVSKNTALNTLSCDRNQLVTINVSGNTALSNINCNGNQLVELDISKNTALSILDCSANQLTSLDVTNNIKLGSLDCFYNKIETLDVSKNTALTFFLCDSNKLKSLDVSKNTILKTLNCSSNELTNLNVKNNTALTHLSCSFNKLSTLDVTKNTALTFLACNLNEMKTLFSLKSTWREVWYKEQYVDGKLINRIKNLVITTPYKDLTSKFTDENFKNEVYALIGKTSPASILYSDIKDIQVLNIDSKNISNLSGIEYFTALTELYCNDNQLTTLDLSSNEALTKLECVENNLTTLDISRNIALTDLDCKNNQLITFYSAKTWHDLFYKTQYTNASHTTTATSLIITIKI